VEVQALDGAELQGTSLLIQATSLGISARDPSPIEGKKIPSDSVALDLCYGAHRTRFLHDAAQAGCRVEDGWRMLAAQGALSFTMWYGGTVPLAIMAQALEHDW
jgi:shikimate dehydrogenase